MFPPSAVTAVMHLFDRSLSRALGAASYNKFATESWEGGREDGSGKADDT